MNNERFESQMQCTSKKGKIISLVVGLYILLQIIPDRFIFLWACILHSGFWDFGISHFAHNITAIFLIWVYFSLFVSFVEPKCIKTNT
jgi:hypothetical protein